MQTPWEYRYANRTQRMGSSIIRELLKWTEQADILSFAGGLPAPEVFPVEKFKEACNTILDEFGAQALQYSTTEGYRPLREMIARHATRFGIDIAPDNILITSGSQQALDFIGRVFINQGDHIVCESPTYLGALQAWNAYGAQYISVPSDENGMIVDELEKALRVGPKFIYVLPNFQNPAGSTLNLERRKRLVELADRYGVPIIEDDPYGQLRYEGEHLPAVVTLDSQFRGDDGTYTGNVIYLSTFSKILAPGIRLAWVVAPQQVIRKLVMAKQAADLHTATFNQMVAFEVGKHGFLDEHVKFIRATYKERRDIMLETMDEVFPSEVRWTHPQGGMFLWGILPKGMDAAEVLKVAIEKKVAFVPGGSFHPNGGGENTMRLNFSFSSPEIIREGITRLGLLLRELVNKN
ncbi:PLP-dependent aminotransferase family protein [bacterium]|nr:PLP-dependent aminotransferase family protein [bacterium]OIO90011.1 MAG: aminotransferase [Anaerolineae bacterium CG2_30_58_95]PIU91520.1 MAG: aminotransferase [Anaerolineae bacterium CG06_land_8_20_14_3_00_57_67]PIW20796.1 MAG: aminotransferase [Anaerolineae bacterium CG17_big_fil_post_rev_8_21_14_2_50_57_27]PJH75065.1 MAG: aminotransferase [Anaerolineae bacterium CG_4_9_14_0_8_um_filter_58_9]